MALRSTQAYVTALDLGAGVVRATQMYVACLTADADVSLDVSNSFSLTAFAGVPTFGAATNEFVFSQLVEHNYVTLDVSNTLGLAAATGLDYEEDLIQYLGWTPRTILPVSNAIFVSEEGFEPQGLLQAFVETCSNDLDWVDGIIPAWNAVNEFAFTQLAQNLQVEECFDELGFVASIDPSDTEYDRDGQQHCLRQHLSFKISGRCVEKEYRPFVGDGGDPSYDDIETTEPTLTPSTLTLTYPFDTPSITLVLKNPKFGNTSTLTRAAIYRKTRGGDEHIVADDAWPTTDVETFEIENLCSTEITDVVNLLNASLGKLVGLLDWEGRQWSGLIMTPETKLTQTGRNSWSFSLVFQKS